MYRETGITMIRVQTINAQVIDKGEVKRVRNNF